MNRKNLTAAVLAGLAGIAGIAGTAQAVNLNPDGVGQVLIYPYYTSNGGNQTILWLVNTTDEAKAVKVRFLEGFNSREVLDFNLYLSKFDVWVAAIFDDAGTPTLIIPDDSCTVPYLYGNSQMKFAHADAVLGKQAFLDLAYNDNMDSEGEVVFSNDGGPTGIDRAAEGHFEIIEMGTLVGESAMNATHALVPHNTGEEDDEGDPIMVDVWEPWDCDQLVDNWTRNADSSPMGMWTLEVGMTDGVIDKGPGADINPNSGGLFGGAAIVNSENGTMYSYNAQAVQGYDASVDGSLHAEPGTSEPSLNSGDQDNAWVFFGVPQDQVMTPAYAPVMLDYDRGVDAISAVFMHESIFNEYTTTEALAASTEWVLTFPTKNFYVDSDLREESPVDVAEDWVPDGVNDGQCRDWVTGEPHPLDDSPVTIEPVPNPLETPAGWQGCTYINIGGSKLFLTGPFTSVFDGSACEAASLQTWDRSGRTFISEDSPAGTRPPVVSPSIRVLCDPATEMCDSATPFELCYEVNVMRFGDGVIFSTPELGTADAPASLLLSVENEFENGWGKINLYSDMKHKDGQGLAGLPVTGFAAFEFENALVTGGDGVQDVKAFYGGLFGHRGNVRQVE